ncbi:hypothetical protein B0H11DRAFT_2231561 [Mycena galericulata]|nr:hypothetical protein B0H11DRAFT_2231561 [Mycena galericulata]
MPRFVDSVGETYHEPLDRRGRSAVPYVFPHQPLGTPIRGPVPTDYRLALDDELGRVLHRESADLVYRGESRPQDSCIGYLGNTVTNLFPRQPREHAAASDVEERGVSLVPTEIVPSSDPGELAELLAREPSFAPGPASSPEPTTNRDSSLAPTEIVDSSDPGELAKERAGPTLAHSPSLSDQVFPPPRTTVTYLSRDKKRLHSKEDAVADLVASIDAHLVKDGKNKSARPRRMYGPATRHSRRLHSGGGGLSISQLADPSSDFFMLRVAPTPGELRPLVDSGNLVVGVYSDAPMHSEAWWPVTIQRAFKAARRVHVRGDFNILCRDGRFSNSGGPEEFVRVGIDFGVRDQWPHSVVNTAGNRHEMQSVVESSEYQTISAYQSYLVKRIAPRMHAHQEVLIDALAQKDTVYPAFLGSVFTTAELSFGVSANAVATRDTYDAFGSFRAFTALGMYHGDWSWFVYFREAEGDRVAIRFPVGATLVVPTSIVRYSFTAVPKGQRRYIFQQYFNAAAGRWVEQGFMSDSEYPNAASTEEYAAHQKRRADRVYSTYHMMSKLHELFI